MKLSTSIACTVFGFTASVACANSASIYDDTFSLFNGSTKLTIGTFDARWGSYSGGVFTPFLGAAANDSNTGYIDVASPELSVSLSQGDNVTIPAGTSLVLLLTKVNFGTTYSSSANEIILTDPSWTAPTFALVGQLDKNLSFTSNTTALKGSYSYNGGNEVLTFTSAAIPEPSSFAAIAGLAMLGFAGMRKRRSA